MFLNNKKIPIISPLFDENRFITDFTEKAEFSNVFFSKQCSLILNNSSLPSDARQSKAYVQLNYQSKTLKKSLKILTQTNPIDMIT